MKAVVCRELGPPENLAVEDIDEPVPGAGEVAIAVTACGVNFPDVLMVAGKYQAQPPLPFVPGAELAGRVAAVGGRVSGMQPGMRVLAMCGHGGMAETVCVPYRAVLAIPDAMDELTAAGFLLTYGTSYHALKQRARLQPGETLLVLGAAGGVGLAAVELGKVMGATVIAAASSADKLALAAEHGADHGIDYTDSPLKEAVRELTGGRGADVIYDPVGGDLCDQCLRCIAWNGRLLIIGFASGRIADIPANLPLLKGASIVGVFWGRFAEREPDGHRRNTAELFELFGQGRLKPHVSRVFPIGQAADALKTLAERRATGKVVVRIRDA